MPLSTNNILVGCMRLNQIDASRQVIKDKGLRMSEIPPEYSEKSVDEFVTKTFEAGLNHYDHADIYGNGLCEEIFGDSIKRLGIERKDFWLQSKCGIDKSGDFTIYDFGKQYILDHVYASLERLQTPYLDSLLLHRPDALFEPEEIAEAFNQLEKEGVVKEFGVSNFTPYQIELLQKGLKQKIVYNQIQLSPAFHFVLDQGILFNTMSENAVSRDLGILDYCRINDVKVQAWSPFQYGNFEGTFMDSPKFPELNKVMEKLADKYNVSKTTIASAWLFRHPANIQMVTGTMNVQRLLDIQKANTIEITKREWYEMYIASGVSLP